MTCRVDVNFQLGGNVLTKFHYDRIKRNVNVTTTDFYASSKITISKNIGARISRKTIRSGNFNAIAVHYNAANIDRTNEGTVV
ncbi:hypothetical protein D3C86_2077620 [compost metagenome]